MEPMLFPKTIEKLSNLFKDQNWDVKGDGVFDRFCSTLSFFNSEQQEFIIELTNNFLRVPISKYLDLVRRSLQGIVGTYLSEIDTVYILPLNKKKNYGKVKSPGAVAYLFTDSELTKAGSLANFKFKIRDNPDTLNTNIEGQNEVLMLVDDYIGTGDTAVDCVTYLEKDFGISRNKLMILTIAIQKQGYDRLMGEKIRTVFSIIREKGISDLNDNDLKEKYTSLMTSIEEILCVDDLFKFGYGKSEALIKMNCIPNNTFPVYWTEEPVINSVAYIPPFTRPKNE